MGARAPVRLLAGSGRKGAAEGFGLLCSVFVLYADAKPAVRAVDSGQAHFRVARQAKTDFSLLFVNIFCIKTNYRLF